MLDPYEFFDALPFRLIESWSRWPFRRCKAQFSQKCHQGLKEVLITSGLDPTAETIPRLSDYGTTFQFSLPPATTSFPSHD